MKSSLAGAALLTLVVLLNPTPSFAHHGWSWTTGGNIELVGTIQKVSLGMPHGIVYVDAAGEVWTVEVGQPWRNEEAGLVPGDLSEGVELRVVGEPAADPSEKRLKAERLYIGDREYDLYPDRD